MSKIGIAFIIVGVIGMIFTFHYVIGVKILPFELPIPIIKPKIDLEGDVTASPLIKPDGKYFLLTIHVRKGKGVIDYAIVKSDTGEERIPIGVKVESETVSIDLKYKWRSRKEYKILVYSSEGKLVGEANVKCPTVKPKLRIFSKEVNYGIVPSVLGTYQVVYVFTTLEVVESEKMLVMLVVGTDLENPIKNNVILIRTGSFMLSKVKDITSYLYSICSSISKYGISCRLEYSVDALKRARVSPSNLVLVFFDTIPYEFRDELRVLISEGCKVIVISPWLGKYYYREGIIWINPIPHPETDLVNYMFNVFESSTIKIPFELGWYNSTLVVRKIAEQIPNVNGIFIFRIGRGYLIWIPSTSGEIPNLPDFLSALINVGIWNFYNVVVENKGTYKFKWVELDYDYRNMSLFINVPIRSGRLDVLFGIYTSSGLSLVYLDELYVPEIIKR